MIDKRMLCSKEVLYTSPCTCSEEIALVVLYISHGTVRLYWSEIVYCEIVSSSRKSNTIAPIDFPYILSN